MSVATSPVTKKEHLTGIVACADAEFRKHIVQILHSADWLTEEAQGGADALAKLEASQHQLLFMDRWLPDLDASELVEMIANQHPQTDILLMDSHTGQFLPAPGRIPPGRVSHLLHRFQNAEELLPRHQTQPDEPAPATELPARSPLAEPLPGMIGTSPQMTVVYRLSRLVAPRQTTVLVMGETGTGKELVARAIHQLSPRANQPFVVVNCAAIPEALLEAELFGYERGAFTGAVQSRAGRIQFARGGTLFLDEVGELPLGMQAKLLRFLQEGEVQRLGSPEVLHVDARVIAATNLDLLQRVSSGQFRRDLYYRLVVFPIEVPPLRARVEDILPLARHCFAMHSRRAGMHTKEISDAVLQALREHSWPGNIRELEHVLERAFILSGDRAEFLPCEQCIKSLLAQKPLPCLLEHNSCPLAC